MTCRRDGETMAVRAALRGRLDAGADDVCASYMECVTARATMNVENRYRGRPRRAARRSRGYQDAVGYSAVHSGPASACRPSTRDRRGGRSRRPRYVTAGRGPRPRHPNPARPQQHRLRAWVGLTASEAQMYDPQAFETYRTSPSTPMCPAGKRLRDGQRRILDAISLIDIAAPEEDAWSRSRIVVATRRSPRHSARRGGTMAGPTQPRLPLEVRYLAGTSRSRCPRAETSTEEGSGPRRDAGDRDLHTVERRGRGVVGSRIVASYDACATSRNIHSLHSRLPVAGIPARARWW